MKKFARIFIVLFACLWIGKEIVLPIGTAALYSADYMDAVVECDTSMEASWYYRQDGAVTRESDVVQMLACHEYDKTRKLLLMSGLPEDYLSWLGLKSLELYQRSPEEFVEQHRFRDR